MSIDERETVGRVDLGDPAQVAETESRAEPTPEPTPSAARAQPVEAAERVGSVDVLRGVALLGILAMNIVGFAWPMSVYEIPIMAPDAGTLDIVLWAFNHLVFETKMMTLFSMLFGGGLVLMSDRADSRGARLKGVYYRRVTWLLVIGLIHAYLIWDGDILVMYASCGFLLYPFRNLRPRTLIITGVLFNLLLVPLLLGFRFVGVPYMRSTHDRVEAASKQGEKPGWWDAKVHDAWREMSKSEKPRRDGFLKEIEAHRSGYWNLVRHRAGSLLGEHTIGFVLGGWWFAGGRMLMGMGLMKLGVFSASRSRRFYLVLVLLGYGIGLPLMLFDAVHDIDNDFFLGRRLWYVLDGWPLLVLYGSFPVVLGHVGAVMLICQSGAIPWLTRRLAAVGRTALSNYLGTSLVCVAIFDGHGLDFFGSINRPQLYLLVLAIWTLQLMLSPIWLEHFRFGPAEWVWRSLTYWKRQPMRLAAETSRV